jgi:hypothetical protein
MIETQAGGLRRCSPCLDRRPVVYHLDQATPIELVDVIETMAGEPAAELSIVTAADRLIGSGRAHGILATDGKRLSDRQPVRPRRILLVALPSLLSALDVDLAIPLLAASEPGLPPLFHLALKVLDAPALFCHGRLL